MVLIGVQSEQLEDFGGSLRASVKAQIPVAINIALDLMKEWGVPYSPRTTPIARRSVNGDLLDMESYEAGRPSAELACRFGDERFLSGSAEG
jgi:hydrogenase maturation protease